MGFEWSAKELSKFGIKRKNLVRVPFLDTSNDKIVHTRNESYSVIEHFDTYFNVCHQGQQKKFVICATAYHLPRCYLSIIDAQSKSFPIIYPLCYLSGIRCLGTPRQSIIVRMLDTNTNGDCSFGTDRIKRYTEKGDLCKLDFALNYLKLMELDAAM